MTMVAGSRPSAELRSDAQRLYRRTRRDPVFFAKNVLGIDLWERQRQIVASVLGYDRVAVRSGHKVGKSTAAAVLALWWWSTRRRARVVLTSASYRQVEEILWREVTRLYNEAPFPLGGKMNAQPSSGLRHKDGREIVGFSTKEPEKMAGFSGDELLFLVDEASGVPNDIFDAIEGNRAGGARLIMLSNPTRTSGYFFDAFHSKREFWKLLHISSLESPNVTNPDGKVKVPGLATKGWVDEKRAEWGEQSPLWAVRVAGDFPAQAENAVVPFGLIQLSSERLSDTPFDEKERLNIGVDVARYGDDETVIWPVRGLRGYPPKVFHGQDSTEVTNHVLRIARTFALKGEKPLVKVDEIGVGSGVVDQLRRHRSVEVVGVDVSRSATASDYDKLRDQLWFGIGDWLKDGGALPLDPKTESELAAVTYSFTARGSFKVESKDSLKKRLGRSPDRADALALAIFQPTRVRARVL